MVGGSKGLVFTSVYAHLNPCKLVEDKQFLVGHLIVWGSVLTSTFLQSANPDN